MTLAAGARFEHYEIESVIGVGGMGEVYRARDTKLERSVALKVVRDSLGTDPDRLARFHREAKLLAALNHPNYVQSFPPTGGKWQVSVNGGFFGYWRRDGREIVFDAPDRKVMAVDVKLGATFEAGIPRPLFELPSAIVGGRMGMTADAQRFLVPLPVQSGESAALRVVQNWPALRR